MLGFEDDVNDILSMDWDGKSWRQRDYKKGYSIFLKKKFI